MQHSAYNYMMRVHATTEISQVFSGEGRIARAIISSWPSLRFLNPMALRVVTTPGRSEFYRIFIFFSCLVESCSARFKLRAGQPTGRKALPRPHLEVCSSPGRVFARTSMQSMAPKSLGWAGSHRVSPSISIASPSISISISTLKAWILCKCQACLKS